MKRKLGTTLWLAAALTLVTSCEQPKINCTTGNGGFAVKYTLKPGSKQGDGACDTLKGEIVDLTKFTPSQAGDRERQDLTKAQLAVRSTQLGALAKREDVEDPVNKPHSLGDFVSVDPDDSDVCHVPELSVAEQDLPAAGMEPAINMKYAWSNLRIHVTSAYPGTQFVGDLTYTENGCSASYSVVGLWPAVSCAVTDEEGNMTGTDPNQCDPEADPEASRPTGSGINPDFKDRIGCDADLGLCVLTSLPDALQ
jgi:hypothetical protein